MKERLRMKITTVRSRIQVTAAGLRLYCPICRSDVEIVAEAQAAMILGVDLDGLGQLIETGRVHTIQTVAGNTWVCKDSLLRKQ